MQQLKGKRGAPVSPIWGLFSDKPDVQMRTGPDHALCRHCHQDVRHHHKVVSVESHLRRCAPFAQLMAETDPDDRPEWWAQAKKKVKKVVQPVPTTLLSASASRTSTPSNGSEPVVPETTKPKRGAPVSPTWALFSDIPDVHSQSAPSHAICRHCHEDVRHHHKVSSVETHLRRCPPFIELVNQINEDERPEWWSNPMKKNKRSKQLVESSEEEGSSAVTKAKRPDLSSFMKGTFIKNTKPVTSKYVTTTPPKLSPVQSVKFQKKMAMHYYVTNSSFQRMEDEHLRQALEFCRPGIALPTKQQLCDELLDICLHDTTTKVQTILEKRDQMWSLVAIQVPNTNLVHYLAVSPQKTLLMATTNNIPDLLHKLNGIDWSGIVVPYPELLNQWKKHCKKYVHGCASRELHTIASSVFTHQKTASHTSNPFEGLADFVDDCKTIVLCFTNDPAMMHKLKSAQMEASAPVHGLTTPQLTPMKWTSLRMMFESLLDSHKYLLDMVGNTSFLTNTIGRYQKTQREQVKTIIQSKTFVSMLKKAIALLSPLDKSLAMLESGAVATFASDIYQTFCSLSHTFDNMDILSSEERTYLVSLIKAVREETCGDAHHIGNLLDPRFIGFGMSDEELSKHEEILADSPVKSKDSLWKEYQEFRIAALRDHDTKSDVYQMLDKGKTTPLQYWTSKVDTWPMLSSVALRVFTIATSSSTSQQTFDTYGHVNPKNRNLLTTEQLHNLIYIKFNTIQMNQELVSTVHCTDDDETEDEM